MELVNEVKTMATIQKTAKQCPKCKIAISKTEGCNKMSCRNCGCYFCWKCNKEVDGYDHFKEGNCSLFDEAEIVRGGAP